MRPNVTGWIAATLLVLGAQAAAQSTPMSPDDPALLGVMAEIPECGVRTDLHADLDAVRVWVEDTRH